MTLRSHTVEKKNPKHNQIWEWEETPELVDAIKALEVSSNKVKGLAVPPKKIYVGNNNYAQNKKSVVK
tara:strand:+ start:87 stop:290 length:204 start_codon:yes stop_codon:yes gene_type:complete